MRIPVILLPVIAFLVIAFLNPVSAWNLENYLYNAQIQNADIGNVTITSTYSSNTAAYAAVCLAPYTIGGYYKLNYKDHAWWNYGTPKDGYGTPYPNGWFYNGSWHENTITGSPISITWDTLHTNLTITGFDETVKCSDSSGNYYNYHKRTITRTDMIFNGTVPKPVAGYTNFTCNGVAYSSSSCVIPAHIKIYDDSTNTPTSWNWSFQIPDTGSSLYSEYQNQDFTSNLTGTWYASHCATNVGGSSCVNFIFWVRQNTTQPYINITTNITVPNFTPIIPTLPLTIAPLPDQLNKSHVRDLINTSVFGNVSADYLTYWDDFYTGIYAMLVNVLDTIFFPISQLTEWMQTPTEWINSLALQYSEKSDTIVYMMLAGVYAFPPKLLNLVTYSLCLDFVLVLMHEFGGKK